MTRTAEQAALAAASLWTVHAVDCAAWARRNLTGPPNADSHGEPTPADAIETGFLYAYACTLTERLNERAERLGLDPLEVVAGRTYTECRTWTQLRADYEIGLRAIGGRLAPS